MPSKRIHAYLALAGAALLWGAAQPLIKPALHLIAPVQYMFLRYSVALPFGLILFIYQYRRHHPSVKTLLTIIGIETATLINLLILYTALKLTSALQSALILNTRPIFITLMGILLLKEREETHEWLGLTLSSLGIILVVLGPQLIGSSSVATTASLLGSALVIWTNCNAAINTYFCKKSYKQIPKLLVTSVNVVYGTFFFGMVNLIQFHTLPFPALTHGAVILPVVYMAFFGTLVALTLQNFGYNLIEASEATLFQYLEPLVYVPLTVFWLKETVSAYQMMGLIIILSGVALAAARLPKRYRLPLRHGIPLSLKLRLAQAIT